MEELENGDIVVDERQDYIYEIQVCNIDTYYVKIIKQLTEHDFYNGYKYIPIGKINDIRKLRKLTNLEKVKYL